jgi:hypothetical protein
MIYYQYIALKRNIRKFLSPDTEAQTAVRVIAAMHVRPRMVKNTSEANQEENLRQ